MKWFEKKPECPLCRYNFADKVREMIIERAAVIEGEEGHQEEHSHDQIISGPQRDHPSLSEIMMAAQNLQGNLRNLND